MRQRLAAERILGQYQPPFLHLGHIVLVDVDRIVVGRAWPTSHMRLDVHRIHVFVFVERKWEPLNRGCTVGESEIVAKRLCVEYVAHHSLLRTRSAARNRSW